MSQNDQWGAGDRNKWSNHGVARIGNREYPLVWGEHPHSRSDNHHYLVVGAEPIAFDGHRFLIDVRIRSSNYLKQSELSGDEVRKSVTGEILSDGVVVYEFGSRDVRYALLKAHALIGELSEHWSSWLSARDREALIGRKVFYRQHPAVISRLVTSQGCVILETVDEKPFPPPIWRDPDDDEHESSVKVEVLSPHIWSFRD